MKINQCVKQIAILLTVLISFQNCSIYRAKEATVDEATTFPGKVKIKTTSNENFKFDRLQKEDGKLYGIVKRTSKTAKEMKDRVVPESSANKFVKINLPDNFIEEIHLKNRTLSTVLGITGGLYIVVLLATGLAIYVILSAF
jgi:hypothetical protein